MKGYVIFATMCVFLLQGYGQVFAEDCQSRPNAALCQEIKKYVYRIQTIAEESIPGPIRWSHIRSRNADLELAVAEYILCMETEDQLLAQAAKYGELAGVAKRIDAVSFIRLEEQKQRLLAWCN
jgi:hypothetical protein